MFRFIGLYLGMLIRLFRVRRSLLLENLALRQQLVVLKRRRQRPGLSPVVRQTDRAILEGTITDQSGAIHPEVTDTRSAIRFPRVALWKNSALERIATAPVFACRRSRSSGPVHSCKRALLTAGRRPRFGSRDISRLIRTFRGFVNSLFDSSRLGFACVLSSSKVGEPGHFDLA